MPIYLDLDQRLFERDHRTAEPEHQAPALRHAAFQDAARRLFGALKQAAADQRTFGRTDRRLLAEQAGEQV